MLLASLLAFQAATPTVVVTGKRLEALHERCVKGGCSPLRDAQVSIAWAETLFRDGRYVDAKRTLSAAMARNKRHAATHPKPVAALYEAYATVAWQEGDQDVYRRAVAGQVRTLRDNLPADDAFVRSAALATGEMWIRLGKPRDAERAFDLVEREAAAAGRNDVALRARIARARMKLLFGASNEAMSLLASAEAMPGAGEPGPRAALAAMRLRFAALDGDQREIERLVTASRQSVNAARPVLIWAPEYPRTALDLARGNRGRGLSTQLFDARSDDASPLSNGLDTRSSEVTPIRWADVGFWIRPDGRTAEVETLRGSHDEVWVTPYLDQVSRRRYAPIAGLAADEPGLYRIERFSLRANYALPIGSLIRRRAGAGKLEVLDLTDPNAQVTASR